MAGLRRVAPVLLINVSLLLCLIAGASLVTAARLKWDPSTYLVIRALFLNEYRVGTGMLCLSGFALIALAQLPVFALFAKNTLRRVLFRTYALLMAALMCLELIWGIWMFLRITKWLRTPVATEVIALLSMVKQVEGIPKFILKWLSSVFPIAGDIHNLIEEVEQDIPRNFYLGIGVIVLVIVLEIAAVFLGLYCACISKRRGLKSISQDHFKITDKKQLLADSKINIHNDKPLLKTSEFQKRLNFYENLERV